MMWAGHGDEPRTRDGVVLAHPLPSDGATEAVRDDVDLLGTGVVEHCMDELAQVGDARRRRVGQGRADRLICREVALIALVAETPQLRRPIAVVAGSTRRSRAGRRTAGCSCRIRACRCCRAGRSPACARRAPRRSRSRSAASPTMHRGSPESQQERSSRALCPSPERGRLRPARRRQRTTATTGTKQHGSTSRRRSTGPYIATDAMTMRGSIPQIPDRARPARSRSSDVRRMTAHRSFAGLPEDGRRVSLTSRR